jgi:hypothetical protein
MRESSGGLCDSWSRLRIIEPKSSTTALRHMVKVENNDFAPCRPALARVYKRIQGSTRNTNIHVLYSLELVFRFPVQFDQVLVPDKNTSNKIKKQGISVVGSPHLATECGCTDTFGFVASHLTKVKHKKALGVPFIAPCQPGGGERRKLFQSRYKRPDDV